MPRSPWNCHIVHLGVALAVLCCSSGKAASNTASCPSVDHYNATTVRVVGQWCTAQQLLLTPDDTVIGEMDYVYVHNQRDEIVRGDWYVQTPAGESGTDSKLVSRTKLSNQSTASEIINDILNCHNETVLSVEIDNAGGISFSNQATTTFWVYNSTTEPQLFLLKLVASQSSVIQANQITAYACPENAQTKEQCGGASTSVSNLTEVANMTTPWLNLVIQRWTFQYSPNATAAHRSTLTIGLAAQIMGLATSPQSLSWCASSIAAIVLIPLIIAMVSCCCCHRRNCCCCRNREAALSQPMTAESEFAQYKDMFAVPKRRRSGKPSTEASYISVSMNEAAAENHRTESGEFKED